VRMCSVRSRQRPILPGRNPGWQLLAPERVPRHPHLRLWGRR